MLMGLFRDHNPELIIFSASVIFKCDTSLHSISPRPTQETCVLGPVCVLTCSLSLSKAIPSLEDLSKLPIRLCTQKFCSEGQGRKRRPCFVNH